MKIILTILGIFLSLFLLTSFVLAQDRPENKPQKNIVFSKDQVTNRDYFAAGDTIIISGTINGDAYLAAGNIIVEGTINGDLLAAGGNVDIRGSIGNNVRAAGGNITVSGKVGNNISVASGSLSITNSAQIGKNLVAGGGSLNIAGPLQGDANLAGGQITLSSIIGGDVRAAGNLTLTSPANIAGNLTYWSQNQAQIQPGAQVSGRISQNIPLATSQPKSGTIFGALAGLGFTLSLINLIAYLILGLLIIKFLPYFAKRVSGELSNQPWSSLGIGFLILLIIPIIIIILFVTILGIPLAFLLLAVFFISIYIGKVMVALTLGKKVLSYFNPDITPGWALLAGLLIYWLLTLIPFVGGLTIIIFTTLGLGALFIERRDFLTQIRAKKLM